MKIVLEKFNIKIQKPNSNINISKISHLPFDMLRFFTWINYDTVRNALKICKYLETTHGSEQRKWNGKII